jgi:hypothetical protein
MKYIDLLWIGTVTWILPVPFLVTSFRFQKFQWLIVCYVLAFATEVVSLGLFYLKLNPNYPSTLYMVFSTIPISYFFYYAIGWKKLKSPLIVFNVFFFLFALIVAIFIQKFSPNYYTITVQNISIILFCIVYYYSLLHDLTVAKPHSDPIFLIVCGWFVTYSGKLVIAATGQYLYAILKDNMLVMWVIFNALTIIGNLIAVFGAYRQWRITKNLSYDARAL